MMLVKLKFAMLFGEKKLFCHAGDPADTVFGCGYSARILSATGLNRSGVITLPAKGDRIHLPVLSARPLSGSKIVINRFELSRVSEKSPLRCAAVGTDATFSEGYSWSS